VAKYAKSKGVEVLDAPLGGSTKEIESGMLTFYVGGDGQVLNQVHNVLESIGPNIFHVGEVGCGNIVKLISNMLANSCNTATAEAFILGTKAGIDVRTLHDVLKASHGRN
jgi:3-hydroxyisobutyrate dehydrogenase-like beta-hydroxyacid dehydrogenase